MCQVRAAVLKSEAGAPHCQKKHPDLERSGCFVKLWGLDVLGYWYVLLACACAKLYSDLVVLTLDPHNLEQGGLCVKGDTVWA